MDPPKPEIRVAADPPELATLAADLVASLARAAIAARGSFHIALAGGSTPRLLYRELARRSAAQLGLEGWQVWFGDERCVGPDDEASNFRMASEAFLAEAPFSPARVHRIPTDIDIPAQSAAAAYEEELRQHFDSAWPRLDLCLLGLGEDGHTASLFPGDPALDEVERWVVAARIESSMPRVTLSLPVLKAARQVVFLVAGMNKRDVLQRLHSSAGADLPASRVRPSDGRVIWFLDAASAPSG